MLFGWADYEPVSVALSAFYFISFVLINAFILFNVFVAVLLDKVVSHEDENEEEEDVRGAEEGAALKELLDAQMPVIEIPAMEISSKKTSAANGFHGTTPCPQGHQQLLEKLVQMVETMQTKAADQAAQHDREMSEILLRLGRLEHAMVVTPQTYEPEAHRIAHPTAHQSLRVASTPSTPGAIGASSSD